MARNDVYGNTRKGVCKSRGEVYVGMSKRECGEGTGERLSQIKKGLEVFEWHGYIALSQGTRITDYGALWK